ncbi:MAG: hypothetical protein ACQXXH_02155 [Candidatus Bathyarchaeia archaeon]|jgi:hypothetical protein|nr:hypothetical protein [Candidatus Bathyarchaeota archaeon A05DMB-4]MDH7594547.1 hypothetical protein [Candidatus Bathyarchaeota archaeon]
MSNGAMLLSLIKSIPHLSRLFLSLLCIYLTLGWHVRKARKAFEKQLVLQGMSRDDARRVGVCYEELKDNILDVLKRGVFSI